MARVESLTYRGITFRRYPDADNESDRRYFRPGIADAQSGIQSLHREVYKDAHGPIPPGYHVHHADHDPSNNDPTNLVLRSPREHRVEHLADYTPSAEHMDRIRILAAVWHASPAGLAWHAEHGRKSWTTRFAHEQVCAHCGNTYETRDLKPGTRFCSSNCRTYARNASGVDDVDRVCEGCSRTFRINKYAAARSCSRKCAWTVRRRT